MNDLNEFNDSMNLHRPLRAFWGEENCLSFQAELQLSATSNQGRKVHNTRDDGDLLVSADTGWEGTSVPLFQDN